MMQWVHVDLTNSSDVSIVLLLMIFFLQGSDSISSAQFFDRDEVNSNASTLDLTASELISRMSLQVSSIDNFLEAY